METSFKPLRFRFLRNSLSIEVVYSKFNEIQNYFMHLKIINYIQVNTRFFKHCLQPRILGSLSCWPCVVTVRNIFVYMYFLFCFVSLNINIHDTHFTLMLIQFHSIFTHSKSAETRQNNQRVKNKRVFFFPERTHK